MKYRIKHSFEPHQNLRGVFEVCMVYEVQERFLWIFWETIYVTSRKYAAESYLEAINTIKYNR